MSCSNPGPSTTSSEPASASTNRHGVRFSMVRRHSPCQCVGISFETSTCWVASNGLPGYHVVGIVDSSPQFAPCAGNPPPTSVNVRRIDRSVNFSSSIVMVEV